MSVNTAFNKNRLPLWNFSLFAMYLYCLVAAAPVCSRLFSLFPQAVDDCDIMDMLLVRVDVWF